MSLFNMCPCPPVYSHPHSVLADSLPPREFCGRGASFKFDSALSNNVIVQNSVKVRSTSWPGFRFCLCAIALSVLKSALCYGVDNVVLLCTKEKVVSSNAGGHIASVKNVKRRYLAMLNEIGDAICSFAAARNRKAPISPATASYPEPTLALRSLSWGFINKCPKSLNVLFGKFWDVTILGSHVLNLHFSKFGQSREGCNDPRGSLYFTLNLSGAQ